MNNNPEKRCYFTYTSPEQGLKRMWVDARPVLKEASQIISEGFVGFTPTRRSEKRVKGKKAEEPALPEGLVYDRNTYSPDGSFRRLHVDARVLFQEATFLVEGRWREIDELQRSKKKFNNDKTVDPRVSPVDSEKPSRNPQYGGFNLKEIVQEFFKANNNKRQRKGEKRDYEYLYGENKPET